MEKFRDQGLLLAVPVHDAVRPAMPRDDRAAGGDREKLHPVRAGGKDKGGAHIRLGHGWGARAL